MPLYFCYYSKPPQRPLFSNGVCGKRPKEGALALALPLLFFFSLSRLALLLPLVRFLLTGSRRQDLMPHILHLDRRAPHQRKRIPTHHTGLDPLQPAQLGPVAPRVNVQIRHSVRGRKGPVKERRGRILGLDELLLDRVACGVHESRGPAWVRSRRYSSSRAWRLCGHGG